MSIGVDATKAVRRAFPGVLQIEADEMVKVGQMKSYPADMTLCQEGKIEGTFYILLEGQVKVTKMINEIEDRFLCYLDPGDFFGEMALIHDLPRTASVKTITPSTVLEIGKDEFDRLVGQNSRVSMAMVREVSRRLRENNDLAVETLRIKAGELAQAYQQLAELEYARSEFLSLIANEMRTPLTVANGFLLMIRSHKLQGDALNSALETVTRNIQDIVTLTNDILFLQEMDFILPDFEEVDVGHVVSSVVEQQRARADRLQVGLSINIVPGLPKVLADPGSLERAIAAVVDNAIKFSPDGGDVNVQVGYSQEEVWIKVVDHGVGIPPEHLNRVFDRFFHLEEIKGHMFRGIGLGLSIARQVIEQHKGKIEVASDFGVGSTFTIRLRRL